MNEQITQPAFNPDDIGAQQPTAEYTAANLPESGGNPDELQPVRLPAAALIGNPEATEPAKEQDTATALRAAHEGWLKRRGFDPKDPKSVPRLTLGEREYDLFRNAPADYLGYARETYGIPQDDQDNSPYALVDRKFDDPNRPADPKLMIVNDVDFGTTIDDAVIAKDFQNGDPDSGGPSTPESPNDAYKTVDITDTLVKSSRELKTFAKDLMGKKTEDPFSNARGDIGVRAGDLFPGQKDAYIWTGNSITKSVELTLAFPKQYGSVCVVRGQMREAANGKAGMAQIDNPEVVLKVEGDALKNLQDTYRRLYHEPGFALTEQQRSERDKLFNDHVENMISQTARENREREEYERQMQYAQQPRLRAREIPRG